MNELTRAELHTIKHKERKRQNRLARKQRNRVHLLYSELKGETDPILVHKLNKRINTYNKKATEDFRKGLKLAKEAAKVHAINREHRDPLAPDPSVHIRAQSQHHLERAQTHAAIALKSKDGLKRHLNRDTSLRPDRVPYLPKFQFIERFLNSSK